MTTPRTDTKQGTRAAELEAKLLAVEAELETWRKMAGDYITACDRGVLDTKTARDQFLGLLAAPPSPPVAPEPAQEAGGVERVSSEGDWQMKMARALGMVYEADGHNDAPADWTLLVDGAEALRSQYCKLSELLDAERTQKEATVRLLEDALSLVAEGDERERALRAENEALRELEHLARTDGAIPRRFLAGPLEKLDALRKQPAEAAPVALIEKAWELCICGHQRADHSPEKGLCRFNSCGGCESFKAAPVAKAEAPSDSADADPGRVYRCKHLRRIDGAIVDGCGWQGPRIERCPICNSNRFHRLAEAPSEPAGWVPGSGYLLPIGTVAELRWDEDGPTWKAVLRDHGWLFEDGSPPITAPGSYRIIEPAPRPPASTGGEDRPDYITRIELASLLRSAGANEAANHCTTGTFGPVGGKP